MAVQFNGKVRGTVTLPMNATQDQAMEAVKADAKLAAQFEGKTVVKVIFVPNKILNIVLR